jgi:hypothetical protein
VNVPNLKRGPVWFEVWPRRFGFYGVYECGGAVAGLGGQPRLTTTVWGRDRAISLAEALQEARDAPPAVPEPVFSTKKTAEIEAAKRG